MTEDIVDRLRRARRSLRETMLETVKEDYDLAIVEIERLRSKLRMRETDRDLEAKEDSYRTDWSFHVDD